MIGGIYGYVGTGLIAIAIVGGAYLKGDSAGANRVLHRVERQELALRDAADQARHAAQARVDHAETEAALREGARQETVREIYRDIPTIVTRPVYRNICLDADGVRLLDRAQAAANGTGANQPGPADAAPAAPTHSPQR